MATVCTEKALTSNEGAFYLSATDDTLQEKLNNNETVKIADFVVTANNKVKDISFLSIE